MRLFENKNDDDERAKIKSKVDKLMKDYSEEKIDGDTYFKKMMNLSNSDDDND
jgi:hypothetical protein